MGRKRAIQAMQMFERVKKGFKQVAGFFSAKSQGKKHTFLSLGVGGRELRVLLSVYVFLCAALWSSRGRVEGNGLSSRRLQPCSVLRWAKPVSFMKRVKKESASPQETY
jgi:hypothetical protein